MAQKSPYRAESAVLLRGAAGTSGAQKLVTRPTGRPEEGTTATGGAQRAEGVELGKSDAQWPGGFGVAAKKAIDAVKKQTYTLKLFGEDEKKRFEKSIQKVHDDAIKEIDRLEKMKKEHIESGL